MRITTHRIDLTKFGEWELIYRVTDNEFLYANRHAQNLREILDKRFIFSARQLDNLRDYIEEEKEEV